MTVRMSAEAFKKMQEKGRAMATKALLSSGALKEALRNQLATPVVPPARLTVARQAWPAKHKFHAQRVTTGGMKFASKSEAAYFAHLKQLERAGQLVFHLWQVPFYIPGEPFATRLVLDSIEFWADGSITFTDVKGMETDAFKIKQRSVQGVYPIKIRTATFRRGDWIFKETK